MKKCIFSLSLFCVLIFCLSAEEKPFITVLDFKANNIPEMEVVVFDDYLSTQIQQSG